MLKFFASLYLNASIIFLLICVCSEFAGLFVVLLGSCFRLGPFGANQYLLI